MAATPSAINDRRKDLILRSRPPLRRRGILSRCLRCRYRGRCREKGGSRQWRGAACERTWSRVTELALSLRFHLNPTGPPGGSSMQTRKLHAIASCALFMLVAAIYGSLTGRPIDPWRVALWSMVGIGSYVALSRLFGFDPHRTRLAEYAPALVHYVDRWELRLGQATLSMLGCLVVAARLLDPAHFVIAVVSGTLSA